MIDKVLIIENGMVLYNLLYPLIHSIGKNACRVQSMEEALEVLSQYDYCLIILDLRRLSEDAIIAIRQMRSLKVIPILAVTNAINAEQKIRLFQAGVHTHVERPFDKDVYVAQVASLLNLYGDRPLSGQQGELVFGKELMICPCFRQVFVFEKLIELTRKEYELLYFLARHPYQIFSYEQLYVHVWKDDYICGGENTVKVHITSLRKKMSVVKNNCIQNEWGVGYKFVPPNSEITDQ